MKVVDVSNVNGPVDWRRVAAAGVGAAFIKATEGLSYDDFRFDHNREAAAAAGVHVGAYHFGRPDHNSAVAEARHFASIVGRLRVGELRPVLDYEVSTRLLPSRQVQWIKDFNHAVESLLGVWPMFYTYPALLGTLRLNRPVGNGIWLAAYGPNDGREHSVAVPTPWRKITAHQFTSRGHVDGVPGYVDLTDASLTALLAHPVRGTVRHRGGGLRVMHA